MPLTFAPVSEAVLIQKISGKAETIRHLNNLGFVEGGTVSVVCKTMGNLIINVKNARIAISKDMAMRIVVAQV